MNEKTLSTKSAKLIFDYVIISVLAVNLIYSLLLPLIENSILVTVFSYICTPICIVVGVYAYSVKYKAPVLSVLKVEKVSVKVIISTLLITFGMMFGLSQLNNIFVAFLTGLGFELPPVTLPEKNFLNVTLVIIFICFTPALFEEFLMRGLIVKGLSSGGKVFAIIVSGILFSIFHMSPQQTIYQFLVGGLYALIVVYGGNFYVTFISHFINNLFIVLNEYFFKLTFTLELEIVLTILGLISLALGVFLLVFKSEKQPKTNEMLSERKEFFKGLPIGFAICLAFWIVNLVG